MHKITQMNNNICKGYNNALVKKTILLLLKPYFLVVSPVGHRQCSSVEKPLKAIYILETVIAVGFPTLNQYIVNNQVFFLPPSVHIAISYN